MTSYSKHGPLISKLDTDNPDFPGPPANADLWDGIEDYAARIDVSGGADGDLVGFSSSGVAEVESFSPYSPGLFEFRDSVSNVMFLNTVNTLSDSVRLHASVTQTAQLIRSARSFQATRFVHTLPPDNSGNVRLYLNTNRDNSDLEGAEYAVYDIIPRFSTADVVYVALQFQIHDVADVDDWLIVAPPSTRIYGYATASYRVSWGTDPTSLDNHKSEVLEGLPFQYSTSGVYYIALFTERGQSLGGIEDRNLIWTTP